VNTYDVRPVGYTRTNAITGAALMFIVARCQNYTFLGQIIKLQFMQISET